MTTDNTLTCEFYVDGMHCPACEIVVEKNLVKHPNIKLVKANLSTQMVQIQTDVTYTLVLQNELNNLLENTGYTLYVNPVKSKNINFKELSTAFILSLLFVASFVLLQKLGIVDLVRTDQVTLPFVFLIGIVASLSTCMAVVGGLVLSLSSSYAKSDIKNSFISLLQFHVSRIVGFFLLGGLIGIIGSAFTLTLTTTLILNLFLFLIMVVMGVNLLDITPFFRRFQFRLPKFLSRISLNNGRSKSRITPILLGISTFILPCGFTQSMQIYSLTTGNFLSGALTMLVFALGTFPVLALISFASVKLATGLQSKLFFRTAGFIVLFFALFNFMSALVAAGLISPFLSL